LLPLALLLRFTCCSEQEETTQQERRDTDRPTTVYSYSSPSVAVAKVHSCVLLIDRSTMISSLKRFLLTPQDFFFHSPTDVCCVSSKSNNLIQEFPFLLLFFLCSSSARTLYTDDRSRVYTQAAAMTSLYHQRLLRSQFINENKTELHRSFKPSSFLLLLLLLLLEIMLFRYRFRLLFSYLWWLLFVSSSPVHPQSEQQQQHRSWPMITGQ
jgi:hypothetical protein